MLRNKLIFPANRKRPMLYLSRVLFLTAAIAVTLALASVGEASGQTFSTGATLQCSGGAAAEASLTLTRDGVPLPNQFGQTSTTLTCGPGQQVNKIKIITRRKPNDWHLILNVTGPSIGSVSCQSEGLDFPANAQCPSSLQDDDPAEGAVMTICDEDTICEICEICDDNP